MKLAFTKMSGAGNDFVVIDNKAGTVKDAAALAKIVCDRRWGIGADGLLLLEPSDRADYRMMYYNADGSYGGMCGNGGRCISQYAFEHGIAKDTHQFEALGHIYHSVVLPDQVVLSMLDPKDIKMNIVLPIGNTKLKMHFVNTGSPHVVIPIRQLKNRFHTLSEIPVMAIGTKIRHHKLFRPEGTNVNFIENNGDNSVSIRTYERGVEAETLACGTGSIASAIIASRLWEMSSPIQVMPASGVLLEVGFVVRNLEYSGITLRGPAQRTFTGEIDV